MPEEVTVMDEKKPDILGEKTEKKVCRLCKHYVINPFTQKCVLHKKYVEALDSCDDFIKK